MLTSYLTEIDGSPLLNKPAAYPATVRLNILYDGPADPAPIMAPLTVVYQMDFSVPPAVDTPLTAVDPATYYLDLGIEKPDRVSIYGTIDGKLYFTEVVFYEADPVEEPPPEGEGGETLDGGGGETTS